MAEDSLVERLVYRLIKKHVAGTTMNSALEKAQEFNSSNMLASIMFLSGDADSKSKARYVTTTYIELIRRISRLGLRASVHIPVGQIGYTIDPETASGNLFEIINAGNKYGVFVWAALNGSEDEAEIAARFRHVKGFGIAAPLAEAAEIASKWHIKAVKAVFDGENTHGNENMSKTIATISKTASTAVFLSPPDGAVKEIMKNRKDRSLVLEFGLGYSKGKMARLAGKGRNVSVNVPFGKDWTPYAMDIVPDGKTHFIVERLMKEGRQAV